MSTPKARRSVAIDSIRADIERSRRLDPPTLADWARLMLWLTLLPFVMMVGGFGIVVYATEVLKWPLP